jgi:hypothetical protein
MTEDSRNLLDLARRTVRSFTEMREARAAMVSGSVAEGHSDAYSDIDMMVYYETLPPEDALEQARIRNGGGVRLWQVGDRDAGAVMESYPVEGVECQIVHVTVEAWERDMAVVLDEHQVDTPLQKALSGTLTGVPLYGEEWISKWQRRAEDYPEPLRLRMVEHYLKFFPIWSMRERFFTRDALLWFHQIRVETLQNLLGILAGVNRVYYTTFQFKHTSDFLHKLPVAPENLAVRFDAVLAAPADEAVTLLESLVRETVTIVERELPQIDVKPVRKYLGK